MLELNDVLIRGEQSTLSMMAREGQLTCLVGGNVRWLHAILGFEPIISGFISIDGEPLTPRSAVAMRRLMAFVPVSLDAVGEINVYEPPTVQDVFALRANREQAISNGLLSEEMKRTGTTGIKAQLLAVAVLLNRRILLIDRPDAASLPYLRHQADAGRIVVICSDDSAVINAADNVVE